MIFVPLIFFSLLLIRSFVKKGLDLGGSIIAMYFITSLFAVILHYSPSNNVLDDYSRIEISFIPTFIYCVLLGIVLKPYLNLNTNIRKPFLRILNIKFFNFIAILYIILFFILLLMFYEDIFYGILQSELSEVRQMANDAEVENVLTRQTSFIGKLFGYSCALLGGGSTYMILFFFYSIGFTNNNKLFSYLIFLSSLSVVLLGMLNADRSSVIRWAMMFIVSWFIFKPYLHTKIKRTMIRLCIILGGVLGVYFFMVTFSRFDMLDGGVKGGLFSYIGQPFLNFCNLWNHVEINEYTVRQILPATNYFILHQERAYDAIVVHSTQHITLNGFETYIGTLMLDVGHLWACVICLLFALFTSKFVNRYKKKNYIDFRDMVVLFMWTMIPMFGCIAYFYSSYSMTINLFLMLLILKLIKVEQVNK